MTATMETIFGFPPPNLVLWSGAILETYKIKSIGCKNFTGKTGDNTSIFNYIENMAPLSISEDKILPVFSFIQSYNEDIPTRKTEQEPKELLFIFQAETMLIQKCTEDILNCLHDRE